MVIGIITPSLARISAMGKEQAVDGILGCIDLSALRRGVKELSILPDWAVFSRRHEISTLKILSPRPIQVSFTTAARFYPVDVAHFKLLRNFGIISSSHLANGWEKPVASL